MIHRRAHMKWGMFESFQFLGCYFFYQIPGGQVVGMRDIQERDTGRVSRDDSSSTLKGTVVPKGTLPRSHGHFSGTCLVESCVELAQRKPQLASMLPLFPLGLWPQTHHQTIFTSLVRVHKSVSECISEPSPHDFFIQVIHHFQWPCLKATDKKEKGNNLVKVYNFVHPHSVFLLLHFQCIFSMHMAQRVPTGMIVREAVGGLWTAMELKWAWVHRTALSRH